ncbi:uncharacterized protein LOC126069728 [Elephas maximus indicus]|uniref:uncharacterized protein LOC126069728 n=1 Tax=Elephas maximus indicus TaxID=99487 RepID=UPI002116AFC9|nr:uncharacterized protein LOC126069728 [Elephas maximus indicus]
MLAQSVVAPHSATPLLTSPLGDSIHQDCVQAVGLIHASHPGSQDRSLGNAGLEIFTGESSFVEGGQQRVGYAVVSRTEVLEANALPDGALAQKVELIAILQALWLAKSKRVTIYTGSEYVLSVLHVHGALWKQGELLNWARKEIRHGQQILQLIEAVSLPAALAVEHCKGHQQEDTGVAQGHQRANLEANRVARTMTPVVVADSSLPQVTEDLYMGHS